MPVVWFVCGYGRFAHPKNGLPVRYCAMDDFTAQIRADPESGGEPPWDGPEILGQRWIVKVRASVGLLQKIAATPGFIAIPKSSLADSLSDLTDAQRNALRQLAEDCGYTRDEIQAAFPGGFADVTLGQVLRFMASRRRKVRYDAQTDTLIDDGPEQPVLSLDVVDARVR